MSVAFFATRDELLPWLHKTLSAPGASCFARRLGSDATQRIELEDVAGLDLRGPERSLTLYLMRADISPTPVHNRVGDRQEFDMPASLAVHFVPCMHDGSILFEGGVGIMSHSDYALRSLDDRELRRWYRSLQRSLRSALHVPGVTLNVCAPGYAPVTSTRREVVSEGAIEWWRSGGQLRQFGPPNIVYFEPVTS